MMAGGAQAAVTVQIFTDQTAAAQDATLAQLAGLGAPDATVSVNAIDFTDAPFNSDNSTIGYFLHNPSGLPAPVANHLLDNTYFYLTGDLFLTAGANPFTVIHDDGLQMNIDGVGLVVNAPGPTGPTPTPFTANAPSTGTYHFDLSYGECCGGPAQLFLALRDVPVGGVPEPSAWAMMLLGFGGLGAVLRKRKTAALQPS
jgi:hypothetical protein